MYTSLFFLSKENIKNIFKRFLNWSLFLTVSTKYVLSLVRPSYSCTCSCILSISVEHFVLGDTGFTIKCVYLRNKEVKEFTGVWTWLVTWSKPVKPGGFLIEFVKVLMFTVIEHDWIIISLGHDAMLLKK